MVILPVISTFSCSLCQQFSMHYFRFLDFSDFTPSVTDFSPPWTWVEMLFIEYSIAAENRTQVLADTRWTEAEAITAITKQSKASGNFVWKPYPNAIFSKLPKPVSRKTKRIEPKNPPTIVAGCDATRRGFAICIPLNNSTDIAKDITHDGLDASAIVCEHFCVLQILKATTTNSF